MATHSGILITLQTYKFGATKMRLSALHWIWKPLKLKLLFLFAARGNGRADKRKYISILPHRITANWRRASCNTSTELGGKTWS